MKTVKNIISLSFMLTLINCSGGDDRTSKSGNPDFLGSEFGLSQVADVEDSMDDDELATSEIDAHVETAIDSLESEMESSASASLSLAGEAEAQGKFLRYRNCEAAEDKATVDIVHGLDFTATRDLPNYDISLNVKSVAKRQHVWSKDGSAVECMSNNKYADIDFDNLKGMNLAATIERRHARTLTLTLNSGITFVRSLRAEASGTRDLTFDDVVDDGDNKVIEKTLKLSASGKSEMKNSQGRYRTLERSVEVKDDPFKIQVVRDASDLAVQSRTIKTGTMVAKDSKGGKVELVFADVKYTPAGGCMPVSGSITGSFYKADSASADRTFTITFGSSEADVEFGDGNTRRFTPRGCWLERPTADSSVSDVSSEDKVEDGIE